MAKGSGSTRASGVSSLRGLTPTDETIIATTARVFSRNNRLTTGAAENSVASEEGLKFSDFNTTPRISNYTDRRGRIMGTSESYSFVKEDSTGPTRYEISIDRMGPLSTTETVITAQFQQSIGLRWSGKQIIARLSESEMKGKTSKEIIRAILKKRYNPE